MNEINWETQTTQFQIELVFSKHMQSKGVIILQNTNWNNHSLGKLLWHTDFVFFVVFQQLCWVTLFSDVFFQDTRCIESNAWEPCHKGNLKNHNYKLLFQALYFLYNKVQTISSSGFLPFSFNLNPALVTLYENSRTVWSV